MTKAEYKAQLMYGIRNRANLLSEAERLEALQEAQEEIQDILNEARLKDLETRGGLDDIEYEKSFKKIEEDRNPLRDAEITITRMTPTKEDLVIVGISSDDVDEKDVARIKAQFQAICEAKVAVFATDTDTRLDVQVVKDYLNTKFGPVEKAVALDQSLADMTNALGPEPDGAPLEMLTEEDIRQADIESGRLTVEPPKDGE